MTRMELARVLYSVDQRRQAQGYGIMTPDDMISGRVRNWITQEDMNARYGVSILLTVVSPPDRFQTKITPNSTNFHQFINSTIFAAFSTRKHWYTCVFPRVLHDALSI